MVCKANFSGSASLVSCRLRATYRCLSPWAFWEAESPNGLYELLGAMQESHVTRGSTDIALSDGS